MEGPSYVWSVEGENMESSGGPVGRQGTGMALHGGWLYVFGGRLAGRGRDYGDDLFRRPQGLQSHAGNLDLVAIDDFNQRA